jgi:hypothetical protein
MIESSDYCVKRKQAAAKPLTGWNGKNAALNHERLTGIADTNISGILETWKLCLQSLIRYRFERLEPSAAVERFERLSASLTLRPEP